ncbi:hypothetical protein HMPREF9452_00653 [Collinsella tanakaei YIT 12063]|uniref:Glycosyl transferase family 1 domain-containing protein n=2 Tax=Collinsella tanakaei TaxID=626935 RepID=G1WH40_9ACTN|nr:hypothetical protein HMPREF9452_00653 [Collinsella tanakaei YIT 12063]
MPYSIVEAFAAGTPVIGTNIGGIPELVIEGETGFICDPDSSPSLTEAIIRGLAAFNDEARYASLQANCRAYVLERCSQGKYMKELTALYKELIDSKKGN